jgi:hypothetical protein
VTRIQQAGLGALAVLVLGIAGAVLAGVHEKRLARHAVELARQAEKPPALPTGKSPADLVRPPPLAGGGNARGGGGAGELPPGERLPEAPPPPVVPPPPWAPGPAPPPTMQLPGATPVRDLEAAEPKLENPQPPPQP